MAKPYASVIIRLLQSHALYTDDHPYWDLLQKHERAVRAHFEDIGVEVELNANQGYARLVQPERVPDDEDAPLKLLRRIPLNYEQSLLCVVLREWLEEHESSPTAGSLRLFVTRADVRERVELFFQQQPNQKAQLSRLDELIGKLESHGFLKTTRRDDLRPDQTQYEVKPLLKAKISLSKLEEFRLRLQAYVESV
ncbi:DUF4194 domain-containing protein [Hymenobacter sp. CRA2]|uniref:DUF4194 domain-containing protein n=1 Tax=Hymenobacter sp. CRA2 TaxID=1955620 RepID=UPI00098F017D|nr:DUF4194 domain-containing protein [Hymenobacter sp. CRA2]OON65480.1 hypothetical protein B0919_24180 [Hymenobacter sp. CRA2]